uniref:Cell division cycle 5-like protein n=1 Tax=Angiostrongylus cantonensis TaxID=6313 RepID=A0A158P6V8_ANGCA
MVRVIIKGGVWRNTEDEILKAAIMKYGKNQWSRIASLLHRKSAKQCKARWFEWLDPGIKKTEWSREEDEKLLHLAKLMPTQWRTIAPIVGRTAAQCLERYEHLLDEAQKKAEGLDDEATEAKRLKPGEIDPTPETKPARPDPIDMDDDELEMLSEARARLANTQGKKAKRKARERQLSEARRLASLQKRREMREAGLLVRRFKRLKRNAVDYSAEIPFEKPVPAGFHDPSEDQVDNSDKHRRAIADHEKPKRMEIENELRKQDREKLKRKKPEDEPESVFKTKEKKRSKLILPAPQISDREMEQIIKIGHASDSVRHSLLTDYAASARANAVAARTARTPAARDNVQMEVQNILALQNVDTPLKGGLNTPLHETDFSGILPASRVQATPNTVLNAVAATPNSFGATPSSVGSFTPGPAGMTPLYRDQMGINEGTGPTDMEARAELRRALASLPEPRNDYEIVAPEGENDETEDQDDSEEKWVDDAADVKESRAKQRALKRQRELAARTQVIQRSLPKPSKVCDAADDLIKVEMARLVSWDVQDQVPNEVFDQSELKDASEMISKDCDAGPVLDSSMWAIIEQCSAELVQNRGKFTRIGVLNRGEQIEALHSQFQIYRDWMNARAKKTSKLEKKLKIKLGGYQAIHTNLASKLAEVKNELEMAIIEKETFRRLAEHETKSINKRVSRLQNEVRQQEMREKELQKVHGKLKGLCHLFIRFLCFSVAQTITMFCFRPTLETGAIRVEESSDGRS